MSPRAAAWMYAWSAVIAIALIGLGAWERNHAIMLLGLAALGVVATAAPLTIRAGGSGEVSGRLSGEFQKLREAIEALANEQALSDDARRVLHRQREREMLRAAIEEDIQSRDFPAATTLVKELAERFGYRADAERFRERIEAASFEQQESEVASALASLESLLLDRRWDAAELEANRISRLHPDSPRISGLQHRVYQARRMYKQDLERRFLHAAKEDRVEEAMNLLKELDAYLTEQEGAQYLELARGVIGKARENLGAQFKLALHDRRWPQAADIGERIIEEFPNSRMAEEVRALIDDIRAKASGAYTG